MAIQEDLVLGFDFGEVRIGVAKGNTLTKSASPLAIIDGRTNRVKWASIQALLDEWQPGAVVVGIPCYPDGKPHAVTCKAMRFARQIQERFRSRGLLVHTVDERYSSVEVDTHDGRAIDDEAAAVILQQWFNEGEPQRPPVDWVEL